MNVRHAVSLVRIGCVLLIGAGGLLGAPSAPAQEGEFDRPVIGETFAGDEPTIQVLPLGSFHFAGAPPFNDPAAPEQQAEIQAVADSLLQFRPTKVAIEREVQDSAYVDSLYQAYREDRHTLRVSEAYQLGFRIARRRGHARVYPIDYQLGSRMDTVMTWARRHKPSFAHYAAEWRRQIDATIDSLHRHGTIREILLHLNSDAFLRRLQALRMRTLEVGADSAHVGIEPPASAARRNMRIFANLLSVAEPGDRILIVYGTGHSHYFRTYIRNHPELELIRPQEYL